MVAVENEYVKFWINEGILFSKNKLRFSVSIAEAEELVRLRHEISNNKPQYWCLNLNNLTFASREAHNYISENGQDFVHACAVVVNSFLVKFIIDVFIQVQKPKVSTRIFSSEESAVKWLMEIKAKNELN